MVMNMRSMNAESVGGFDLPPGSKDQIGEDYNTMKDPA
jgi:hypothetical protein